MRAALLCLAAVLAGAAGQLRYGASTEKTTSLRPAISIRAKTPALNVLFDLLEPSWSSPELRRPAEAQPSSADEVPWVALPPYVKWPPGAPLATSPRASSPWADATSTDDSALVGHIAGDILLSIAFGTSLESGHVLVLVGKPAARSFQRCQNLPGTFPWPSIVTGTVRALRTVWRSGAGTLFSLTVHGVAWGLGDPPGLLATTCTGCLSSLQFPLGSPLWHLSSPDVPLQRTSRRQTHWARLEGQWYSVPSPWLLCFECRLYYAMHPDGCGPLPILSRGDLRKACRLPNPTRYQAFKRGERCTRSGPAVGARLRRTVLFLLVATYPFIGACPWYLWLVVGTASPATIAAATSWTTIVEFFADGFHLAHRLHLALLRPSASPTASEADVSSGGHHGGPCCLGRPGNRGAGGRHRRSTTPSPSTTPTSLFENHPHDTLETGRRIKESGEGQGDINCSSPEDPDTLGASECDAPPGVVAGALHSSVATNGNLQSTDGADNLQSKPRPSTGSSFVGSPIGSAEGKGDEDEEDLVFPLKKKNKRLQIKRLRLELAAFGLIKPPLLANHAAVATATASASVESSVPGPSTILDTCQASTCWANSRSWSCSHPPRCTNRWLRSTCCFPCHCVLSCDGIWCRLR
jgi:hypothetical protein